MRKDGTAVPLSNDGERMRQHLKDVAKDKGSLRVTKETGAAEECEREVLQEMEEEEEAEKENEAPRLEALGEETWASPGTAMLLETAAHVSESQGIKV